jgi:hypothetical protein
VRKLQENTTTYDDNLNDNLNEGGRGNPAVTSFDDGCASLNSDNQLGDDGGGAIVVGARGELGKDGVALVAEGGEGALDVVGGPLRNDLGDSSSDSHSTSGENSEDGGETHGEERLERGWRGWRRLLGMRATGSVDEIFEQNTVQLLYPIPEHEVEPPLALPKRMGYVPERQIHSLISFWSWLSSSRPVSQHWYVGQASRKYDSVPNELP